MKLRWKIAQAAEIRWWKAYLKKKDSTQYATWKRAYWQTLLQELIEQPAAGMRCLDAGCGPAGVFMALQEQQVQAVDPLLEEYQQLPHFNPTDYPWATFKTQPLEDFQTTTPFDWVFCLNAINHVSDLEQCWKRLMDATASGGRLVVSIDAHNHTFFKHLFRLLPGDILHPHQYDLAEYEAQGKAHGGRLLQALHKDEAFFFDYYVLVFEKI
ncbi:MAG: class I SAM-dependent methyltransferase [Aureispira sp.]